MNRRAIFIIAATAGTLTLASCSVAQRQLAQEVMQVTGSKGNLMKKSELPVAATVAAPPNSIPSDQLPPVTVVSPCPAGYVVVQVGSNGLTGCRTDPPVDPPLTCGAGEHAVQADDHRVACQFDLPIATPTTEPSPCPVGLHLEQIDNAGGSACKPD